jgi:hypothetical protein
VEWQNSFAWRSPNLYGGTSPSVLLLKQVLSGFFSPSGRYAALLAERPEYSKGQARASSLMRLGSGKNVLFPK